MGFARLLFRVMALLCFSANVLGAGLDISLSDDSGQFSYLIDSDSQIGIGGADIGAGLFVNDADDVLLNFSFLVVGNSTGKHRALQLGVGTKAYLGKLDIGPEDSIAAIAISGKVSYIFPANTPMALSLEAFIAPDITAFGDNKDFTEWTLRFEIEVAPTARFFVGYRNMEAELEDSGIDYELDDSAHIGVRFSF